MIALTIGIIMLGVIITDIDRVENPNGSCYDYKGNEIHGLTCTTYDNFDNSQIIFNFTIITVMALFLAPILLIIKVFYYE